MELRIAIMTKAKIRRQYEGSLEKKANKQKMYLPS